MATGGELIIDEKLVRAIYDMEKALKSVSKEADITQRNTLKWIEQLRTGDIDAFTKSIQQLKEKYANLSATLSNVSGMEKVASTTTNVADSINRLITTISGMPVAWDKTLDKATRFSEIMSRINNDNPQNRRNSAMVKLDEEIENALKRLGELQKQLNFYTKGEGKKAIGFVDLSAIQTEAKGLMNHIDLLKRKRESVAANARLRLQLAETQEARDRQWASMEIERQEKLQNAQRETNKVVREHSKAISENREEQTRAYTKMFDKAISNEYNRLIDEKKRQTEIEQELDKKRYEDWQWQKKAEVNAHARAEEQKRKEEEKTAEQRKRLQESLDNQERRREERARQRRDSYAAQRAAHIYVATDGGSWNIDAEEAFRRLREQQKKESEYVRDRTAMYSSMFDEIERKEKKVQDDISNYERSKFEERLNNYRKQRQEQASVDKHYHDLRQKEYDEMFRAIERNEQRQRQINAKYGDSSKGALNYYNRLYSENGGRSIQKMEIALSQLREAQKRLDLSTESGKKRFKELGDAAKQVEEDINELTGSVEKFREGNSKLMDGIKDIGRSIVLLFSVDAIKGYVDKLVDVRKELELQYRSLAVLIQDRQEADALWNQTMELAVKSPFRIKELVTYTKQLAAYRIETDKLHSATKMLADVSAGLGVDMNRLILAYGQVRAAEYLRGTELRQFTEAGIPMLELLAEQMEKVKGKSVSTAQVFEMISKRMISFKQVDEVFKSITSSGGMFYQMQEKQSQTLSGMISNLHDSIDLMLNDIGKANDGILKTSISAAKTVVDNWEKIAEITKRLAAAFALYQYQLLLTNKALIRIAVATKIASKGTAQLKFVQLLQIGYVKLSKSIQSSAKAMFAFAKSNPTILGITAMAAAVYEISRVAIEHKKRIDEIEKKYKELGDTVNNITFDFNSAKQEGNIEKQKSKLEDLIELANKKYKMEIEVDIKSLSQEEINKKYLEIEQGIIEAQAFAKNFELAFAKQQEWTFLDDILESMTELSRTTSDYESTLITSSKNIAVALDRVLQQGGKLSENQTKALEMFKAPKNKDEDMSKYLERLAKAYSLLGKEVKTNTEMYQGLDAVRLVNKYPWEDKNITRNFESATKVISIFANQTEYAQKKFDEFWNSLNLPEGLSEGEKKIYIEAALDGLKSQENITQGVLDIIREQSYKKWGIPIMLTTEKSNDPILSSWQFEYNKLIEGIPELEKITDIHKTHEAVIKEVNEEYTKQVDLLARIKKGSAQAYEGYSQEKVQGTINALTKLGDWLGIDLRKDKDKKEEVNILKNRISLIKELNKEYKNLNKTFDSVTSEKKVLESFGDTFKKAFEGTGINLSGLVIDNDKLEQLKKDGEKSGQVFSESMLQKMNEVIDSGTYIRKASESFRKALKEDEGVKYTLYDDATGKAIKNAQDFSNKVGTATIGIGHAVFELSEATEYFGKTLSDVDVEKLFDADVEKHEKALNQVLDKYNELILTQEQYDVLLNKTYQGGAGAINSALEYATNVDEGLKHFETLSGKLRTIGSTFEQTFGEDFVEKFKNAQTASERLALVLQTINLTTKASGSNIDKNLFSGMLKRSKELAAIFSGDLNLVKMLEKASINISQIDFTNIEGVIETLKKLAPLAVKEGKEAELALSKAISEVELELGEKNKVQQDKELIDHIESMFGNYEVSLEMEKLNIPPDLAQRLFGVESIDLSSIRSKIEEEIAKIGTDKGQEDLLKQLQGLLKKVDKLDDDALKERMKRYAEFLKKGQTERVKIKIEELRDLAKLEEDYQNKKIGDADYELAKSGIQKEAEKKLQSLEWDEFKESDTYIRMFEDLDYASKKSIEGIIERLKDMRENLKELSPTEIKEITNAIERLEDASANKKPFASLVESIKPYISYLKEREELEERYSKSQKAEANLKSVYKQEADNVSKLQVEYEKISKSKTATPEEKANAYDMLETAKQRAAFALDELEKQGLISKELADQIRKGEKIKKTFKESLVGVADYAEQAFNALPEVASNLENVFGELSPKLKDAMDSVSAIGGATMSAVKNFASGNYIGAIVDVTKVVGEFFKIGDKRREREIQRELKAVERLSKEYEKLQKKIEDAFTLYDLQQSGRQSIDNLEKQKESYEKIIAVEEAKKKSDSDKIDEYKEKLEELEESIEETRKEVFSKATDGILDDVLSTARGFVDAWYDAFKETGDGMKGLEDNFNEMLLNMVKQQAAMTIVSPFIDRLKKKLEGYVNENDIDLSTTELTDLVSMAKNEYPVLAENLKKIFEAFKEAGLDTMPETGELSGLQRGIESVSEATAQIIEAYLNAIRMTVVDNGSKMSSVISSLESISNSISNTMVGYLKTVAEQTSSINALLEGVRTSNTQAIRVELVN